MSKNLEIDNIDLKILALLSEDAKIPYTEIAKKVYVSGGTVHVRMRKMEEMVHKENVHTSIMFFSSSSNIVPTSIMFFSSSSTKRYCCFLAYVPQMFR